MAVSREVVLQALSNVIEPERNKDLVRLDMVKNLKVEGDAVSLTVVLRNPESAFAKDVSRLATEAIRKAAGSGVEVSVSTDTEMLSLGDDIRVTGTGQGTPSAPAKIQNYIAVASGKGGVGKSTVAVNLALALEAMGYSVGLVDMDIYGPSVPTMLGLTEKPRVNENRKIVPLEKHGLKLLSMGLLVDPHQAMIWRGPMVSSAVRQFLGDAEWGELDYLVLDLPPGTGDIQLTIVQTIPLTGAVIVSTPQEVALADARKGVTMFRNVKVPVLGVVENMSYFSPPDMPDRKYFLFGNGGARRLAGSLGVPFLGEVPIEEAVREGGDAGEPALLATTGRARQAFEEIAKETVLQVAIRKAELPPTQPVEILYR